MATLTAPEKTTATEHRHPADSRVELLTREEVAEIEAEIAVILAPTSPAALTRNERLVDKIIRPVLHFFDEISGPPMTQRERWARDLAETRFHKYAGLGGF